MKTLKYSKAEIEDTMNYCNQVIGFLFHKMNSRNLKSEHVGYYHYAIDIIEEYKKILPHLEEN